MCFFRKYTFFQIIDGVGTPLALHGNDIAFPSTVLNICGPCFITGITEKAFKKSER